MRMLLVRLLPFVALVIVLGCSESGPRKVEVSGTVKYDGKEITEGEIVFHSVDKSAGPDGAKIVNGKYTINAREGKNKVEIRATHKIPGKKGPMGEDWVDQFITEEYNDKTTLSHDVKSSGNSGVNFDLTTNKRIRS